MIVITCDSTPIIEVIEEVLALLGDGRDLPDHLRKRLTAILKTEDRGHDVVRIKGDDNHFVAQAGPELLSILATLRALRQANAS